MLVAQARHWKEGGHKAQCSAKKKKEKKDTFALVDLTKKDAYSASMGPDAVCVLSGLNISGFFAFKFHFFVLCNM